MNALCESDRERLLRYLLPEAEYNCFIIGDVACFGFDSDIVDVYMQSDYVIMRYLDSRVFYSQNPKFDAAAAAADIASLGDFDCLSGKTALLERLYPLLGKATLRRTALARYRGNVSAGEYDVTALSEQDAPELLRLFLAVPEFYDKYKDAGEKQLLDITTMIKSGHGYGVRLDGKIVSTVFTTAENPHTCMLTSICTHPDYTRRGIAKSAVSYACKQLSGKCSRIVLYYDNPAAGALYNKLGFEDIGSYAVIR